ncbi:hypothetical protein [Streptomyces sp. NRRL F-2664]|uniref:hypothetical protein n=1 Tax=Streptomyces sp. NRRL F-2664 TaxID=1463842 RepID=UPI00131B6F89|nr:hypothetical protein [Streptomyces sp. NRRL F-2664]
MLTVAIGLGYTYLYTSADTPQPAPSATSLSQICADQPRYLPLNPPYDGPGPHPIVIYQQGSTDSKALIPLRYTAKWKGTPFLQEPQKIELVACARRAYQERTNQTCAYEKHRDIPLYRSVYRIEVFEARSAKKVREVLLWPKVIRCPVSIVLSEGSPNAFALASIEEYAAELKPLAYGLAATAHARIGEDRNLSGSLRV